MLKALNETGDKEGHLFLEFGPVGTGYWEGKGGYSRWGQGVGLGSLLSLEIC